MRSTRVRGRELRGLELRHHTTYVQDLRCPSYSSTHHVALRIFTDSIALLQPFSDSFQTQSRLKKPFFSAKVTLGQNRCHPSGTVVSSKCIVSILEYPVEANFGHPHWST